MDTEHLRPAEDLILAYLAAHPHARSPQVITELNARGVDEQTALEALWHLIDLRAVTTTLDRTMTATPEQRMRFNHQPMPDSFLHTAARHDT